MEKDLAKVLDVSSRHGIDEAHYITRSIQSSHDDEDARAKD